MELTHRAGRSGVLWSFLRGEMEISVGLMNKLKRQEKILVNGTPVFTNYPVAPGDMITVILDEPAPAYPAEEGPLSVLYEDSHLLAVDKPAGMLIHPSRAALTGTLANRVLAYYEKTGQKCAFHPVTRLDRDTFGVVLLAKNSHIHSRFTAMQERGQIRKRYHALVLGTPEPPEGVIDAPIARLPLPSLLRQVSPEGKPSRTGYRVLQTLGRASLLELEPFTGRTHQLRVHCAHMGFPILGDPQYGRESTGELSRMLGLSYQMLCAKSLEFPHPVTGENLRILSNQEPIPAGMKNSVNLL